MRASVLGLLVVSLVACGGRPTFGGFGGGSATASSTGSTASAGGSASTGAGDTTSTASGPPAECSTAADCPGMDLECIQRRCDGGKCSTFYPVGTPAPSGEIPGDCAASVCDGSGNTKLVYDAKDAPAQVAGDCKATTCSGIGTTTQAPDLSDMPMGSECSAASCTDQGPKQTPVDNGTVCSAGLCKDGGCVAHIQVWCVGSGWGTTGCDGVNKTENPIYWNGPPPANTPHECINTNQVEYCPPGTPCHWIAFSMVYDGVCQ